MISRSVRLMFVGGVAVGALAQPVMAQEEAASSTQRIEITGSSIKRIAKEGALPVQTLTAEDIKKSGATSVTELMQNLPAMQGFVPAASSINTGGGGGTTAALHSMQSKYTLVLLDGQRMAPALQGNTAGGGFSVNLESIPLDAIERVEILTDGASATYGSDAIAGVVNFITKKNKTDGNAFFNYNVPQHPGGRSYSAGLSKGWGDLDTDGFNVLASYSHDYEGSIRASQRDFSKAGGIINFNSNGQAYRYLGTSSNNEPGNLFIPTVPKGAAQTKGTQTVYTVSPYYTKNGNCGNPYSNFLTTPAGPGAAAGGYCNFNFASFVEDNPSTVRDSGLLKGTLKINDDTTAWAELIMSTVDVKAQFAPPSQPLAIGPGKYTNLYNNYVLPFLAANNLDLYNPSGSKSPVKMGYRPIATGGRADDYNTNAQHFAMGIDGLVSGWNYKASLTLSRSTVKDYSAGGFLDAEKFNALVGAGSVDPLGGSSGSALQPALLNGTLFSTTVSDMNTAHVGAQHDWFDLPGGTSIISMGADYSTQHYSTNYSDLLLYGNGLQGSENLTNFPLGGSYGAAPFDAKRNNYGVYGELLLPITKTLEATISGRYDSFGRTHSEQVYSSTVDPVSGVQPKLAAADLGNTFSAATYKLSFRWTPQETLLFRGAYGTGFKAPAISDLAGAVSYGGSSNSFPCPLPGSPNCLPGSSQYDLLTGGNGLSGDGGLKPEKSTQWTLGFRVDPLKGLSLGLDLWNVTIKNQVLSSGIAQQVAFSNPAVYKNLFVDGYVDAVSGATIALQQFPLNGGVAHYQGIDWDTSYRTATPIGNLSTSFTGTYMMKQDYTLSPGGTVNSDLGQFGADQAVVFRIQMHLGASLQTGKFTNALSANYKSGYRDVAYTADSGVYLVKADGSLGATTAFAGLKVPSYTTFDWQGKYDYSKTISVTAGIRNLFDRAPPLSLQPSVVGNAAGYDPRYADVYGRALYVRGNYKF
ncbi:MULTISPECIES: TonB-dependent receptor domain-containing protein [unclassified Undibacterium]|uniref:TonB-dependent receptor domain-containing protein n=2 Tax=Undibacterium TaxID=401469 RepID=UPI002AC8E0EE|nr:MULTISPECIES: TonB-dependent receptor [unclassified Undibacterium]MEB0138843.1 TonB-dependent receptor [Undibacterium sp. CCC2.1]MEB0172295.1 TonB-dependent receptor [Undibacterium sp. CCC1.1]MEB0176088.1 TonB-dependent receptor [Undibacterium sp. CCC3.4]MEB0215951.1 TonB-dependent receptor [Undibacterium sp. 5I2]WPX44769.1 TonB-dependent receptor [Undibacterium sp. CCC3.4]